MPGKFVPRLHANAFYIMIYCGVYTVYIYMLDQCYKFTDFPENKLFALFSSPYILVIDSDKDFISI